MRLMFVGHEGDPTEALEVTEMGIVFPRGEAVSVPGDVFEKLSPNPAFKAVPAKPGRPPKSSEGTE
jgi:hypothetical protein